MPRNGLSVLQSASLTDEMERNAYRRRFRDADDPRLVPGTSFRQSDVPMTVAGITSLLPMLAPMRAARIAKGVLGFANESSGHPLQDLTHAGMNRYFAMQDPLNEDDDAKVESVLHRARGGLAHLDQGGMPYWTNNNGVMSTTNIPFSSSQQLLSGRSPGLSFLNSNDNEAGSSVSGVGGLAGLGSGFAGAAPGDSFGFGGGNPSATGDTAAGVTDNPGAALANAAAFATGPMGAFATALANAALGVNAPNGLAISSLAPSLGISLPGLGETGITGVGALGPTGAIGSMSPSSEAAAMGEDLSAPGGVSASSNALPGGAGVGGVGGFGSSTGAADMGEAGPSGMGASAGDTGGASGSCYITTAAVDHMGLKDKGPELSTLRRFRDQVLSKSPEGQALISEYDRVAPKIVEKLNATPDPKKAYRHLYEKYINPAIKSIRRGDDRAALDHYGQMVRSLEYVFPDAVQAAAEEPAAPAMAQDGSVYRPVSHFRKVA